eukprot:Pgem_evm1s12907
MMVDEMARLLNPGYGDGIENLSDKTSFILQKMKYLASSDDELHKASSSKGAKRSTLDRKETDESDSSTSSKGKKAKKKASERQAEGTLKKPCSECGKKAEDRYHKKWDCKRQTDAEFRHK